MHCLDDFRILHLRNNTSIPMALVQRLHIDLPRHSCTTEGFI